MVLGRHDTPEQYVRHLRETPSELEDLYADALIGVTSFFRNAESFEVIARTIWPALLRQRGDEPLRVWVLGCSTGEEAYSVAMSFVEAADEATRPRKLQVFATDLNEVALHKARHGLYDRHVARDLSPERLHRFFVEEDGGYRVSKSLREMVVFARQNVISDPPFSRMDLISCRNLLIYFDAALQKRVFPMFHYALRPGGFLYLGASESVGTFTASLRAGRQEAQALHQDGGAAAGATAIGRRPRQASASLEPGGPRDASARRSPDRGRPAERRAAGVARGRPHRGGALCAARRPDRRQPADRAVPRRHGAVPHPARGQGHLRPAEDGAAGLDAAAAHGGHEGQARPQTAARRSGDGRARRHDRDGGPGSHPADEPGRAVLPGHVRGRRSGRGAPGRAAGAGARRAAATRRRGAADPGARGGAGGNPRLSAVDPGAARIGDGRPAGVERGSAVGQRGAPEHQRGAGDVEGGDGVGQRGAHHAQRGDGQSEHRAQSPEQRPRQRADVGPPADRAPRPRPDHPPFQRPGRQAVPAPAGRRGAPLQPHPARPRHRRSRHAPGGRDPARARLRARGARQGRLLVLAPRPSLRDGRQPGRWRRAGAGRHQRREAQRAGAGRGPRLRRRDCPHGA